MLRKPPSITIPILLCMGSVLLLVGVIVGGSVGGWFSGGGGALGVAVIAVPMLLFGVGVLWGIVNAVRRLMRVDLYGSRPGEKKTRVWPAFLIAVLGIVGLLAATTWDPRGDNVRITLSDYAPHAEVMESGVTVDFEKTGHLYALRILPGTEADPVGEFDGKPPTCQMKQGNLPARTSTPQRGTANIPFPVVTNPISFVGTITCDEKRFLVLDGDGLDKAIDTHDASLKRDQDRKDLLGLGLIGVAGLALVWLVVGSISRDIKDRKRLPGAPQQAPEQPLCPAPPQPQGWQGSPPQQGWQGSPPPSPQQPSWQGSAQQPWQPPQGQYPQQPPYPPPYQRPQAPPHR